MAKRDEVRAIGKLQLREATRLDAKYKNINPIDDDERFEAQSDYSNEIQKLLEKQTIGLFQTVVNKAQLNDQDKQLFEPGHENSDFWGAQSLHDMNAALEFFS